MNKKIVILVVLVECVLAILLISVLGNAIESYFNEIGARDVYFVDAEGNRLEDGATISVERTDLGYQLQWVILPDDTTDTEVKFTSTKAEVTVDATGYVTFDRDVDVVITVSTKNGKTSNIHLVPKKETGGTVDI
ncbi:MAG: hypothetical protein IJ735_06785 [Clostridia bacterium]|nr:hypothetical protein [Clostridia bacterium]